ncbi:MAG: MarR family transcriptional regulator [Coprococcus sp.]|nr:MarR family transcriptional regulator [Coprococcus sp.]
MKTYISKEMKRYNHLLSEMDSVYHEMSLKLGVSDSAMIILYTICNNGDCCLLQEICRLSGISKQTVNSALRKLEADGIVYLKPSGAKNKMVYLTDAGKHLAQRTAVRIIEAENDIFASWSREDVARYLELTEQFLTALSEKSKQMQKE